jgi:pyruvate kinase
MIEFGVAHGREIGCIQPGDVIVVTVGIQRTSGSTDTIRVLTVPPEKP